MSMEPSHQQFGVSSVQRYGDAVAIARDCLNRNVAIAPVSVYWIDDEHSHDDDEQGRLLAALESEFAQAAQQIDGVFGPGRLAIWNADKLEWDDAVKSIPISGIACASFWRVEGARLFLAASKEDRETPFILVVGVTHA